MYYWCLHHTITEYTECQGFRRRRDRHSGTLCILQLLDGRGGKGNHRTARKKWSSKNHSILSGCQGYVTQRHYIYVDCGVFREYTVTHKQIYYYSPNSFRTFQGPSADFSETTSIRIGLYLPLWINPCGENPSGYFTVSAIPSLQSTFIHIIINRYQFFLFIFQCKKYGLWSLFNSQRDSVTRFFAFGFNHESVSPQPQSIPFRPFAFFQKFAEIFASQGSPPVSTTPVANFPPLSTIPAANNGKNYQTADNLK